MRCQVIFRDRLNREVSPHFFFETATKQADQIAMESARATGSACRIILVVMKRVTTSNADMERMPSIESVPERLKDRTCSSVAAVDHAAMRDSIKIGAVDVLCPDFSSFSLPSVLCSRRIFSRAKFERCWHVALASRADS